MPRLSYRPYPSSLPVINGPYSGDEDTTYEPPQISYGADAEIARKQRELALSGLSDMIAAARQRSLDTPELAQQRANIAAHGTIENPQDFARRTGMQTAADALDPSNPVGRLRQADQEAKLAQIHESNVAPAEIGARSRKEIADLERQTALDESSDKLAGSIYGSDASAEAKLESELADQLIGGTFGQKGSMGGWAVPPDADRQQAVQGFMRALDQFRRRYGRQAEGR